MAILEPEVREAFYGVNRWKAWEPDGILALFHHKLWDIIGSDVSRAILESVHLGRILKQISHIFICLIPKIPNPDSFSKFRSISLCNVIYKGISKCISNHLKRVMPTLIGPY